MDPIVAHYRIIEKIGEGGMGVVYRARDERLNRDVALKFLPSELDKDAAARSLLVREARTASALNHPNICTIHDVGEEDGRTYIVMEFVGGRPLEEIAREGPMPTEAIVRYGEQIADALAHAHQHGVVHRDLKSANILVSPEGRIKILDFGLARHLEADEVGGKTLSLIPSNQRGVVGTLHYIAPEVFRGELADARSDIWALGVILYEMAAGRRPFRGKTAYELSALILNESPPPLPANVAPALTAVINRCLIKDPGRRYPNAGEVRAALEAVATQSSPAIQVIEPPRAAAGAQPQNRIALIAILAVVAASIIGAVYWKKRSGGAAPPAGVSGAIQSLAVLPLENLSGDPKQDYFADGMSDALITDLSQIRGLRVISRGSVMQYKGKHVPVSEIAKELNVDAVVEGTVLRSEDRVRISAELVRGQTQQNLWAQSYERAFQDVLSLQNDIARDIVKEIQMQITQQERARLSATRAVIPAAYDAYLEGRYQAGRRTGDALTQAVADYRRAIQLDPSYAPAFAGLATSLALSAEYKGVPPAQLLSEAETAAKTAVRLDDGLAEAHEALGYIRYSSARWPGVISEYERAIELNPGEANAHHWYALALSESGKPEQGIVEIKLAQELDPRSRIIKANVAWCLYLAGKYDDAIEQARKAIAIDPSFAVAHGYLGQAYLEKGKYEDAFMELQKAISLSGGETSYKAELANAYALAGRGEDARAALDDLQRLSKTRYISPYYFALIYTGLGEKDAAFEQLNKACEARAVGVMSLSVHPRFASLRSDPRFKELLAKTGY
jgi:TolB-like protein/Flp pilus assembly protein TadD/tRNA A-37 threonylcarbamoyl transferase component Bud32